MGVMNFILGGLRVVLGEGEACNEDSVCEGCASGPSHRLPLQVVVLAQRTR
ncbi:Ubiquitin-conjugating enzyme E2 G2 [Caligus rogercresseyi]|uniref:Ubiquitin-conjugating enzyme E2 G2 n=1 Tax=Caligus rogercresseyi TaxID=217165 RepID=A0A7T8KGF5_CALRO|nr:Ubiquitin-conjugating enzyme E2 G2 [Caligus rogercresseyi]